MVPQPKDARELLAFYLDAGADALIGEEPIDRMTDEVVSPSANVIISRPDGQAATKWREGGYNFIACSK